MRRTFFLFCTLMASMRASAQLPGFPTSESEELVFQAMQNQVKVTTTHADTTVFGSGVWLGNGWVLTANHLFTGYRDGDSVQVSIHGKTLAAKVMARGDMDSADLALLHVEGSPPVAWSGPRICSDPTAVASPLGVVSYDNAIQTFATPEHATYSKGKMWSEATTASMSPGVSGSPVFDESQACLTGIISRVEVHMMLVGDNPEQQKACLDAARGQTHQFFPITCGTSAPTLFSSLERMREFLKSAGIKSQGL